MTPKSTPVSCRLGGAVSGRLFAVLDAAAEPYVYELVHLVDPDRRANLYSGERGEALADVAPHLIEVREDDRFADLMTDRARGRAWGILIETDAPLAELRRHLRRLLVVTSDDGRRLYFRFYDPRVLPAFLAACTAEELAAFFGPILAFHAENDEGAGFVRLSQSSSGLRIDRRDSVAA